MQSAFWQFLYSHADLQRVPVAYRRGGQGGQMSPGAGHGGVERPGKIFWQGNIRAQNSKCDRTVTEVPEKWYSQQSILPRCIECIRSLAMRILSVRLSDRPSVRQTRALWQTK